MMFQKCKTLFACGTCFFIICLSTTGDSVAQQFGVPQSNTRGGAVLGGVTGAIIGGIAGNQNDETAGGIAIGGVVGAIAGGLLGKAEDNHQIQQHQYQQHVRQAHQQRLGRAVSVEDAIVLTQNGVSPKLIVNQIFEHGVTHRVAVNEIIHLHKNGVNENVITAMQEARLASQTPVVTKVIAAPVHHVAPVGHIQIYSKPRYGYSSGYNSGHRSGHRSRSGYRYGR